MLTRIYIDNFRCFVNFEFKPGPKQLILGANGSGKSSFMDALILIRRLAFRGESLRDLDILDQRTRWEDRPRQTFHIEACLDGETYLYQLGLEPWGSPVTQVVALESVHVDGKLILLFRDGEVELFDGKDGFMRRYPFDWRRSALASILERQSNGKLSPFQKWLESLTASRINPFAMTSETRGEDFYAQTDLSNLASWYRHLSQEHPLQNVALTESLQAVLDSFAVLGSEPAGRSRMMFAQFLDASGKSLKFGLEEISEGQRCLICLYMILHFVLANGGTVVIDGPDNFISLREIQPWLMSARDAVDSGNGQLILISHHPEVLNQWAPEYGVRFVRDGLGPVRVQEFHGDPDGTLTPAEIVARGWEE